MIRPFTCCCLLLAAASGLYAYQAKHQSELLDREIARTLKLADAARQRSSVLRAEYALLNDPSRLSELAAAHLPALHATEPQQFTNLAELDRRLPPVGPPPSAVPSEPSVPSFEPEASPSAAAPLAPPGPASTAPIVAPAAAKQAIGAVPVVPRPLAKPDAARAVLTAQSLPPPLARPKPPPVQRVAMARAPRLEPFASSSFITPAAAPAEALARLAQAPAATGGATASALGMARTGALPSR